VVGRAGVSTGPETKRRLREAFIRPQPSRQGPTQARRTAERWNAGPNTRDLSKATPSPLRGRHRPALPAGCNITNQPRLIRSICLVGYGSYSEEMGIHERAVEQFRKIREGSSERVRGGRDD